MSKTIAANGTNGKIFCPPFCPHYLQLAVAEEDADDSMHTKFSVAPKKCMMVSLT